MSTAARTLMALALLTGLAGCYKDDVDPAKLTGNPFDPAYDGPAVFSFIEVVNETYAPPPPAPPGTAQWVRFRVNSALFLAPASYQVRVRDLTTGAEATVGQAPAGSDELRYKRDTMEYGAGQVCLELRLSNNLTYGRTETICGPLQ